MQYRWLIPLSRTREKWQSKDGRNFLPRVALWQNAEWKVPDGVLCAGAAAAKSQVHLARIHLGGQVIES